MITFKSIAVTSVLTLALATSAMARDFSRNDTVSGNNLSACALKAGWAAVNDARKERGDEEYALDALNPELYDEKDPTVYSVTVTTSGSRLYLTYQVKVKPTATSCKIIEVTLQDMAS